MRRLWRPKRDSQKTPGTAQPSSDIHDLLTAVRSASKRSGGKLAIYRRQSYGGRPAYQREMSLQEALGAESFLTYLHSTCGDGEFIVQLQEVSGKLVREFIFAVGKVKPQRAPSDEPNRPASTNSFIEGMKVIVDLVKPAQGNGNNWVEMMKAFSEIGREEREFRTEMTAAMFTNVLAGGQTSELDSAAKLLQVVRELQPQVEQQDSLTALLQGLLTPIIAQSMAAGNPLASLQKLQAPQQAAPPGASQGGPSAALATSPPAAAPGGEVRDHRVVPQGQDIPPPGPAPADPHQAFYDMTILPFRQAAAAGATPEQLGNVLMGIVATAKQWQGQNPHPLVAELVSATTPAELNRGFTAFCSAIPEISQKPGIQAQIRDYLTSVLTRAPAEVQPDTPGVNGAENEEDEEDVRGPDVGESASGKVEDRPDGQGPGTPEQHEDDPSQVG